MRHKLVASQNRGHSLMHEVFINYARLNTSWCLSVWLGKMQTPLPELLKEYGLPVGIFPCDATNYEFNEETGKLTVFIPSICEVGYKDSSVLRFFTTVTGYLEKGKLAEIEGMKTKVMIWVKVTAISAEGSKLHFTAGMKKTRSRDAYEALRDAYELHFMLTNSLSSDFVSFGSFAFSNNPLSSFHIVQMGHKSL
ncbi:uncharacterized protein At5g01610-like [Syzygium oleosum]|uniref:uncharacterized protein At5g01610-like n=1 Tax=Syzygium oleosum TaxID=219896 RepID=UPI0024BA687D|nr:uncharacterized protein At5g01610-like [Syzygium oleosum]